MAGEFELVRETPWVKEWKTPWGNYVDSKLRWLGVEPAAAQFIAAWTAASDPERFDLEAAFAFYPYEYAADIEEILEFVALTDLPRAERMRASLFTPDTHLSADQQRFLDGLGAHLAASGAPMRLVAETKWFRAYANDAGFHLDTKVSGPFDMPTDDELREHLDVVPSVAYQRIIKVVLENRWLLEPRAGEGPFPG